jgi:hypothetical protein
MAIQVLSTQDVVFIGLVWPMTQPSDDVFDDACRQRRDRQEGINFECGPNDQPSKNYEVRRKKSFSVFCNQKNRAGE